MGGNPKSAQSWSVIASEHPEFFKFNQEKSSIVLLLRSLNLKVKDTVENNVQKKDTIYSPLRPEETMKLIDFAIAFHDKQLARYQMDFPIRTTRIAAYAAFLRR